MGSWPVIQIACAKLPVLVGAPSVQIPSFSEDNAEVVADADDPSLLSDPLNSMRCLELAEGASAPQVQRSCLLSYRCAKAAGGYVLHRDVTDVLDQHRTDGRLVLGLDAKLSLIVLAKAVDQAGLGQSKSMVDAAGDHDAFFV